MNAASQPFDGWANVQTFHANLLLRNDARSYFGLRTIAKRCGNSAGTLSYYMRTHFTNKRRLWEQDLSVDDLAHINWDEIAEHWLAS